MQILSYGDIQVSQTCSKSHIEVRTLRSTQTIGIFRISSPLSLSLFFREILKDTLAAAAVGRLAASEQIITLSLSFRSNHEPQRGDFDSLPL